MEIVQVNEVPVETPSAQAVGSTTQAPPKISLSQAAVATFASKVPKGITVAPVDCDPSNDRMRCLIYGYTDSWKTTTAAEFGGPERTLIISTRDPEQVRIPLRGKGYRPFVLAFDADALLWALQFPEKAADAVGFSEWKDREDRVLMVDDWTEGASLLVDDNSVSDSGKDVRDGRKIYGATKEDVRAVLNSLKQKHIHQVFTALADENEWQIWPQLPKGARRNLEASFDYVFFADRASKKLKTTDFNLPYPTKDEKTGAPVTRLRNGFAKTKTVKGTSPLGKEEGMDLRVIWAKVVAASTTAMGGKR